MKITDVNIDCLEKAFKYLEYEDLFNVAASNMHLRKAAQLVHRLKYRKLIVQMGIEVSSSPKIGMSKSNHYANIIDLKTCFRLLRYFGNSISHLDFDLEMRGNSLEFHNISVARLMTYVNQYCSESLIEIKFFRCFIRFETDLNKPFENLTNPFANVKIIEFGNSTHINKHFFRLFPNIENLTYTVSKCTQITCLDFDVHFPSLQNLSIRFTGTIFRESFTDMKDQKFMEMIPYVLRFIRLHPQIRILRVPCFSSETFIFDVSTILPHLENLQLDSAPKNYFNLSGNFNNLKKLMVYYGSKANNVVVVTAPKKLEEQLSFDQLEEFHCDYFNGENAELHDMINRLSSIKKLTLTDFVSTTILEISPLAFANVRNIEEINFRWTALEIGDPILYIRNIKTLKKFSFLHSDPEGKLYEDLQKRLRCYGWHVTFFKPQILYYKAHFTLEQKI